MGVSKIRIGVYGAMAAGKTTFWRQVVKQNGTSVVPGSKLAQFITLSTEPDGKILPSTATVENLQIPVDGCSFLIDDGPGNSMAECVDRLDRERRGGRLTNPLARHIAQSDVFFFFLDPMARSSQQEMLRAKQLIDFVLESRQNRILPILFILTHQDSAEMSEEARCWIDEVGAYLAERSSWVLSDYFPRPLIRKENVFHPISLIRPDEKLLQILWQARSLVELARDFRRQDRKRSCRLIFASLLWFFIVLMLPVLCLTSPTVQRILLQVRLKTAPVFDQLPSLPTSLMGEMNIGAIDLSSLQRTEKEPFDEETASSLNRSLFILMKRLNKLEDTDGMQSDEYRTRLKDWAAAFTALEKRFDSDTIESQREKHKEFEKILAALGDSPARSTEPLNELLKKYWGLSRCLLAEHLRHEITIHREANTPSEQILDELCRRLEVAFRDVSESKVRGDRVSNYENRVNQKELLKQDIRKVFIACRNYKDRYPVEIKIQSAMYESDVGINRDYDRRLIFSGGKEKSDVYIDLLVSSGFQSDSICTFLPSRKDLTVSFVLDHPLLLTLQQKKKGSQGEWEKVSAWEMSSEAWNSVSLQPLGVLFYLRFENDENTSYLPEGKGFQFELVIRRPRSVPEFLWDIVDGRE